MTPGPVELLPRPLVIVGAIFSGCLFVALLVVNVFVHPAFSP